MSDRGQRQQIPLPTSVPVKIGVPVRVAVDFAGPKIKPLAFVWSGRKYVIERVNLVYQRRDGEKIFWCFAVSDAANSYILRYDPTDLRWTLEEVYAL